MDLAAYFAHPPETTGPMPLHIMGASRNDLPELFKSRGYTTGAEVGVYKGEFAEVICRAHPTVSLLCVDRWAPYRNRKTGRTIFHSAVPAYDEARARLAPYDCHFIKADSVEAAQGIPDESLDFVYIDADHWFPAVVADLAAWIPKVKRGGVIAGHDYAAQLEEDNCVRLAIEGWTLSHGIVPWYVLGRFKTRRGEHRDPQLTWMWFA